MRTFLISFLLIAFTGCGGADSSAGISNIATENSPSANKSRTDAKGERSVVIDSPDGVKLVGTFRASDKPNSPAILLLHQWQSDRHSYDEFAKQMQVKGFNVLAIDGRGFGESVKTADGKTVTAERTATAVKAMLGDVGAAFDFLAKQKNADPARIGIIGASYGSSLALIYAADNPRVAAVALLSPGLNYFGNMPTEPAVAGYGKRPLLLVAAGDDKESANAVNKLKAADPSESHEAKIYEKGGHGTGLFAAKVGLENVLEQFLEKALK